MKLTTAQRRVYNLIGVKPFSKISQLPVGTRLQYFYRRDDGQTIRHTATIIKYDSPGELVLMHHDNELTQDSAIWDFDLTFDKDTMTRFYPLAEKPKKYEIKCGIGSSKYAVSFYDGVQTHPDGSDFYGIELFKNKGKLSKFVAELQRNGYTEKRYAI